jgi:hypothetical protein
MLVDGNQVCDRCHSSEQPEPVHGWDYCPTCKANWLSYEEGRRDQALDALGRAIDVLLEEDFTHFEVRKAVQLRLQSHVRQEQEEALCDAFREAV